MKRVWTIILTIALIAAGCAGDDGSNDIFASSENIGGSEQADDAAPDAADPETEPQGADEVDVTEEDLATSAPEETAAQVDVSDDLQGFIEQFFAARDVYFIEAQDPFIEQVAAPTVLGVLDTERFNNLDEDTETNPIRTQQSQPTDVTIEEVDGQSVVRVCADRVITRQAGEVQHWIDIEMTVSEASGSFTVDSFEVLHDASLFIGLGCVPNWAAERALTLGENAAAGVIEMFADPISLDRDRFDGLFDEELLAEFDAGLDSLIEANQFMGNPVESQVRILGSDPGFLGQTVVLAPATSEPTSL